MTFKIIQITVETYDNPGWGIKVYFEDTISNNKQILFSQHLTNDDWLLQVVDKNILDTSGGSEKLAEIARLIVKYLNLSCIFSQIQPVHLEWLSHWYSSHCDGNWEHTYGVRLEYFINKGWSLKIDLEGTYLEEAEFISPNFEGEKYSIERDEFVSKFNGYGKDLNTLIFVFRKWAEETKIYR